MLCRIWYTSWRCKPFFTAVIILVIFVDNDLKQYVNQAINLYVDYPGVWSCQVRWSVLTTVWDEVMSPIMTWLTGLIYRRRKRNSDDYGWFMNIRSCRYVKLMELNCDIDSTNNLVIKQLEYKLKYKLLLTVLYWYKKRLSAKECTILIDMFT